jgi:hypothetical protein
MGATATGKSRSTKLRRDEAGLDSLSFRAPITRWLGRLWTQDGPDEVGA